MESKGNEGCFVADSRKRGPAALLEGSGCPQQSLVAKRKRWATDTSSAEGHEQLFEVDEKPSAQFEPAANQEIDGPAGTGATAHSKQLFFWIYFVGQLEWLQRLERWVVRAWALTT